MAHQFLHAHDRFRSGRRAYSGFGADDRGDAGVEAFCFTFGWSAVSWCRFRRCSSDDLLWDRRIL